MNKQQTKQYLISEIDDIKGLLTNDPVLIDHIEREVELIVTKYNDLESIKILGITIIDSETRILNKINKKLQHLLNFLMNYCSRSEVRVV